MIKAFKKFKDVLLGVDIEDDDYDDYDDDYDDYEDEYDEEPVYNNRKSAEVKSFQPRNASQRPRGTANLRSIPSEPRSQSSNNVVDLHKKSQIDIILPKNIEDARDVIDNTKSNIISVINLEGVDGASAQRIADFLSGSVDALDGNIRRLSHDMFVIAPKGVDITGNISTEINEELRNFGSTSSTWLSSAYR